MAERSDEIFIYLRAIGADKTARDINKVARATGKLNDEVEDEEKVQGKTTETVKKSKKAHKELGDEVETTSKKVKKSTGAYAEANKLLEEFGVNAEDDADSLTLLNKVYDKTTRAIVDNNKQISKSESDRLKRAQAFLKQNEDAVKKSLENEAKARDKARQTEAKAADAERANDVKREEGANREIQQSLADRLVAREKSAQASEKIEEDRVKNEKKIRDKDNQDFVNGFNKRMSTVDQMGRLFKRTYSANNTVISKSENILKEVDKEEERISVRRKKRTEGELQQLKKLRKARLGAVGNLAKSIAPSGHGIRPYMALIGLLITSLPMIGTFFNALGAGAIALLGALGQLSGVLGAIPAGMLAAAQGMGVFAIAFSGLGKAMTDANAFAQLGPQAQNLVLALNNMRTPMKMIQNNVRENLFMGLGLDIQNLSKYYLPMLNSALTKTAKLSNTALRNFTGWMSSQQGKSTVTGIADTNAVVVGNGIDAGQRLLQTFLLVANAAGPMLREMSADLVNFSHTINNWVSNNQDGIGSFFMRGYEMFKGALKTIGNFGMGFYNIIKLAAPLTEHILGGITTAGEKFKVWTESAGGVKKIKDYFKEMQPNLDAVMHLAGAFAKAIFDMSRSAGFQKFVEALATAVPKVATALEKVANSGILTELVNVIGGIAVAVGKMADLFHSLPGWMQKLIIIGTLFGGIITGIGLKVLGIINALKGFSGLGFGAKGAITTGGGAGFTGGGGGAAVAEGAVATGSKAGLTAAEAAAGGYVLADGTKVLADGKGGFKTAGKVSKYAMADPLYADKGNGSGPNGKVTAADKAYNKESRNVTKYGTEKPGLRTKVASKIPKAAGLAGGARVAGGVAAKVGLGALDFVNPIGWAALAASILNPILSPQAKQRTPDQLNKQMQDPTLKKFFSADGGMFGSDVSSHGFGPLKTRDVTDLGSATGRLFNKSGYEKFSDWGGWTALGGTSDDDKLKNMFSQIDTGLASLDPEQAQAKFAQYEQIMKKNGASDQQILDMFPQYKASVAALNPELDNAKTSTDEWLKALGNVPDQVNKVNTSLHNIGTTQTPYYESATSGPAGAGAVHVEGGSYFAGGLARGGTMNTVGELGPEVAINRAGQMSMVGMHGMEMFKPRSDTAIIPSSATFDPLNGNYGNSPLWAKELYQGGSESRLEPAAVSSGMSSGPGEAVVYSPHVTVTSSNASPAEIEAAVGRAIRKADRDRRERR